MIKNPSSTSTEVERARDHREISGIKNYLANLIIIWLAIVIYHYTDYYQNFLNSQTQTFLFILAISYTILAAPFYFSNMVSKQTHAYLLLTSIKHIIKNTILYLKSLQHSYTFQFPKLSKQQKTAILFLLVKFFYLPLMLNFVFNNYHATKINFSIVSSLAHPLTITNLLNSVYPFALALIFFVDTAVFAFSYAFESKYLKNTVRSVEPTFIGWAVALVCYPPFNSFMTKHLDWFANDTVAFPTNTTTLIARIIIICLTLVFVGSTLSLGTKSSNLTNRGIVSKGTYSIVRHPAYISKVIAWWIMIIPIFSLHAAITMAVWTGIYFARAITEENHLSQDPDYIEYKKKVKYMFIPHVI